MKKVLFGIFAVVFSMPAMALTVSGTVLDNNDNPLVGATIYEPNSQRGITTDVDGNFSEAIDVDAGASLKISFVGCKEQTVKASDPAETRTAKTTATQQRPANPQSKPVNGGNNAQTKPGMSGAQSAKPVQQKPVESSNKQQWHSKNFAAEEDDEFEFEFLSWDGTDEE